MKKFEMVQLIEATHAQDPGRLRHELLAQLGEAGETVDTFETLHAYVVAQEAARQERSPELAAAAEHIARVKQELGIA